MKSKKGTKKDLSRRDFIKTTAVGVGATAVAGLTTREANAQGRPVKWDKETDVVVVGSGGAGLCAAIEATYAGASALVLEKGFYAGGNTLLSAGNTVLGATHVQARLGIEDHPEWWYEDQMAYARHRAVPELMRVYTKKGGELALWLEQLGLVWRGSIGKQDDGRVPRGHGPAASPTGYYVGTAGLAIVTVLFKEANRLGVPILLNHKVTRILRPNPNGPVLGVEVDTPEGTINIRARKAVVLACGGWKANTQMRMAWDPRLDADLWAGGLPYVQTTGDGIMAALDIGAGLTDMSFVCELRIKWGTKTYQVWEPSNFATAITSSGLGMNYQRVIMVKNDGQRYVDESAPKVSAEDPFYEAFLNLEERPRNVWAVTDAEGAKAMNWPEATMRNPNQPQVSPALYPGCVAVADTLPELAGKMGMRPAYLDATVSRYNSFVDAGEDKDFGKPKPLYPIKTPPFFGAKLLILAHDQMGALRANTKAQVLDRSDQLLAQGISINEEEVIPRLYAAGECVGGYVGAERGHGKMGVYMIWGRIAGKNAAKELSLW